MRNERKWERDWRDVEGEWERGVECRHIVYEEALLGNVGTIYLLTNEDT